MCASCLVCTRGDFDALFIGSVCPLPLSSHKPETLNLRTSFCVVASFLQHQSLAFLSSSISKPRYHS